MTQEERREKKRARERAYRAANLEKVRGKNRAYHEANREKLNARMRVRRAENRDANREKAREANRAYRAANREKLSARSRARYAANTEKVLEQQLVYREANREKLRASVDAYRARNPQKVIAIHHNRRARKRGAEGTFTDEDIARIYKLQKGRCAYCRCKLGSKYHRDHIVPLTKGGTNWPSNIQLTCDSCNLRKGASDPIEFARRKGRLI